MDDINSHIFPKNSTGYGTLINFECKIDENIIHKTNTKPPENGRNENTAENNSEQEETINSLKEFDDILHTVCKRNILTDVNNTDYEMEIGIEVNSNNLEILHNIDMFEGNNKDSWQAIYTNFVKNTVLNKVQYNNDLVVDNRDMIDLEFPIDYIEIPKIDNGLGTYEDLSYETHNTGIVRCKTLENTAFNTITRVLDEESELRHDKTKYINNETTFFPPPKSLGVQNSGNIILQMETANQSKLMKSFNRRPIPKTDVQHNDATINYVDNHKTVSILPNITAKHLNINISNETKVDRKRTFEVENTNVKKLVIDGNVIKQINNQITTTYCSSHKTKSRKRVVNVPIINIDEIVRISTDEDYLGGIISYLDCNTSINTVHNNINALSNKESELNNNEVARTLEVDTDDCDGYNSSDFEFIDEDEAKNKCNFKSQTDELQHDASKSLPQMEIISSSEFASTKKDFNNNSPFEILHHDNAVSPNDSYDENPITHAYLKSLYPTVNKNTNDSSSTVNNNRTIPNDEEFAGFFVDNRNPCYEMYRFENKDMSLATRTLMNLDDRGCGLEIFVDKSTPEERRQAKESERKILSLYAAQNGTTFRKRP